MDDAERDAELRNLHHRFHDLAERVARLEEMAKDFQMMKAAVAGAMLSALAALAVALLKGG